jgi:hypothetical protein
MSVQFYVPAFFTFRPGTGNTLRRRLSGTGCFEEKKCLAALSIFKPQKVQPLAWILYTLSNTAIFFFGEGLAKTTNSRRTCADLSSAHYGCQTRCIKLFSVMRATDVVFVFPELVAVYTYSDVHRHYGDDINLFYFLRKRRRFI